MFLSNKCNQSCSKLFKPFWWGDFEQREILWLKTLTLNFPQIFTIRAVNICDKHKSKRCFWVSLDMLGEINFQSKLCLRASHYFVWKLLSRQKKKVKCCGTFRKVLGSGTEKPSVTDLSHKQSVYRHYPVSFHGKGMSVQCRPAVQCHPTWRYLITDLLSHLPFNTFMPDGNKRLYTLTQSSSWKMKIWYHPS